MNSSDLRGLVGDVRELLEFLDEIGGDTLELDGTYLSRPPLNRTSNRQPTVQRPTPPSEARPAERPAVPNPTSVRQDLSSVLSNTKLSSIAQERSASVSPTAGRTAPMISHGSGEAGKSESKTMSKTKDLSRHKTLDEIKNEIGQCTRCGLCEERTQVVHSIGDPSARLMFIGEAPGADEDAKGEPFVGRAGQLLTRIIDAMGFRREDVFIGNINRCRPPGNRAPKINEADECRPFLLREIEIVKPEVIVVLGNTACQNLLNTKEGISKLRGNFQDYFGLKVMPTFHPAYLLRDPSKKKFVWEDMKQVMEFLNGDGDQT